MSIDAYQAYIFDLDGTVLSNEDEYGAVFRKMLSGLGVEVTGSYPQVGGVGVEKNWQIFLEKYDIKTKKTVSELTRETQVEYLKILNEVEIKPGFEELINDLREAGKLTALATSNVWWIVEEVMEKFDLSRYFDVITTAEEVLAVKPDPEIFIITARKLGVDYEECVVFEDSPAGITAALTAGMGAIGVAKDEEHAELLNKALFTVFDFSEVRINSN